MGISSKGSYCLMLLEGGLLPIKHIIISRRLNYLQNLLKSDSSSLSKQVFLEQCKKPNKQDWATQILKDLDEFQISLTFNEIENLSKYQFKKIVKKASYKSAFKYLIGEKEKQSKGENLNYLYLKTQNYLKPGTGLTTQDMKQIYSIRTRNLFLKSNFPGMFTDNKCVNINCNEKDTEYHLFYADCFKTKNIIVQNGTEFNQIFSNDVPTQKTIKDIIMDRYQSRLKVLSSCGRSR